MNSKELPQGWVWTKLEKICSKPQYGWTTSAVSDGTIPLLRTSDITTDNMNWEDLLYCKENPPETEKYTLHDGDIVFSRAGSVGFSYLIKNPPKAVFASYLIRIRPFSFDKYVSFFMKSPIYWKSISDSSSGITLQNINAKKLKNINIPLPPLNEQHRIVEKIEELFTRLDSGIESLQRIKAQIKTYRQSVLKSAMEGRLTQEWREKHEHELEPASELLERIKEERKKKLGKKYKELPPVETSELPELPGGWVWTRVGEVSNFIQYGYTASSNKESIGPKMLRITDIQNNLVNWDEVPYCKIESKEKQKYLLKEGDLVFARTGATVGKSYLIKGDIPEAVFASYLIRISLSDSLKKEFINYFFKSNFYWSQIYKGRIGIGQPNVNSKILAKIYLPLASIPEQQKIVEEIERLLSVADDIEKTVDENLQKAEKMKQSILKKAFEGRLVPQDPNDEPADVLLERIKEEKERESKKKNIKSAKTNNKKQKRLKDHVQ